MLACIGKPSSHCTLDSPTKQAQSFIGQFLTFTCDPGVGAAPAWALEDEGHDGTNYAASEYVKRLLVTTGPFSSALQARAFKCPRFPRPFAHMYMVTIVDYQRLRPYFVVPVDIRRLDSHHHPVGQGVINTTDTSIPYHLLRRVGSQHHDLERQVHPVSVQEPQVSERASEQVAKRNQNRRYILWTTVCLARQDESRSRRSPLAHRAFQPRPQQYERPPLRDTANHARHVDLE